MTPSAYLTDQIERATGAHRRLLQTELQRVEAETVAKIRALLALPAGTLLLNDARFVRSLEGFLPPAGQIAAMSARQMNWLDDLHERHCR